MASVYLAPKEIKEPVFSFRDIKGSKENEERYIQEVKDWCIKNSPEKSEYVGKMIRIQHADSYACYIVFKTTNPKLIHLAIGDAWDSPMATLLTGKRIKEMVNSDNKLAKLFSK